MTAALTGHAFPDSFNEFGRFVGGSGIKCTRCGFTVFLIVHNGQVFIGTPINTPCTPAK